MSTEHTFEEAGMANESKLKDDKVAQPASYYETPKDLIKDKKLSLDEKKNALNTWEQDAHQLLTASNEGMPGSEEGIGKDDHDQLGQVGRAKEQVGEKPKHKPSH
jgi:hypothetical protein